VATVAAVAAVVVLNVVQASNSYRQNFILKKPFYGLFEFMEVAEKDFSFI